MGMAAAQAKLLSLTARRSDINYQLSSLMRGKLDLMTQASNAADALSAAQRNNNIFVMTTSDNQQTQLSFNSLSKEGLTIVDAKGRTIVPSSYRGNVKGLANALPASHPAVKSYDGDFVPKTKLTKNYVSIPENTIPMFAETDPENREQKTVKAAQGEPTVQTQYNQNTELIKAFLDTNGNNFNIENLANLCRNNSLFTVISNKQGEILKDGTLANGASEIDSSYSGDYRKAIENAFKTELDSYSGRNEKITKINKSLGASYTSYDNRKFQYGVTWDDSNSRVNKHQDISDNSKVTYVSNAEQFITALLKDATVTTDNRIQSKANIMLLNDIDLDDMLQDENTGKGGLKAFIQNEISTLNLKDGNNDQINAYNAALDNFINLTKVDTSSGKNTDNTSVHSAIRKDLTTNLSKTFYNLAKAYGINVNFDETNNQNITNKQCIINILASREISATTPKNQKQLIMMAQDAQKILNEEQKVHTKKEQIRLNDGSRMSANDLNSWDKIAERLQAAAAAAAVGGTKSEKSGIDASVLAHIYSKYFSGSDTNDKFNEEFTNFIQIDDFRGAIGGGGFAINNLKMDATKGQFAGMFGCISSAVLDGIWMDNAQVLSSGNTDNKQINASILAYGVYDNSFINVSAKGQQFTISDNDKNCTTKDFLSAARNNNNMKTNESAKSNYVNAGWSIVNHDLRSDDNMKKACENVGIKCDPLTFGTGGDNGYLDCGYAFTSYNKYAGVSYDSRHVGWRTVAADIYDKDTDKRLFSEGSNDDLGDQTGFNMKELDGASRVWVDKNNRVQISNDPNGALYYILENSGQANSKIKFYTKEDVKSYTEPKDDAWKNGAKFDDGTVVDWQDWDVVDGFNSETGEYTLVKKHGEETEEYLQIKDLLEFYKEQNVRVEYDENRETGCFTYSASGYSIDVEYKEDLNKYLSDNYLYKVENNDSSIVVYERDKVVDIDSSQLVFVDDIEAVLDKNIKNGVWFVQGASVSDASKYERKSLDEIGISETTDEKADAVAQAEYDRKIREIEIQEEKYDAQITELESTLKGIEQEIENQEKIVKQNIQSSFSTFSS